MSLTLQQELIHAAFMQTRDKFNPLGIDFFERAVVASIFAEHPNISLAGFGKLYLARCKRLDGLAHELQDVISKSKVKNKALASSVFVKSYFEGLQYSSHRFEEQVISYRLASRFLPVWLRHHDVGIPGGYVKYSMCSQPESPFTIDIFSNNGTRLGTIGGFLFLNGNKKIVVEINNVQGVSLEKARGRQSAGAKAHTKELHLKNYADFNRALGENWRVFFVKKIVEYANKKGLRVDGIIPHHLDFRPRLRKSAGRQYSQTYRKAGLTENKKGTWFFQVQKKRKKRN